MHSVTFLMTGLLVFARRDGTDLTPQMRVATRACEGGRAGEADLILDTKKDRIEGLAD